MEREAAVGRWLTWALVALLGALCLQPVVSRDTWWHLSYGRWIWENGALPLVDSFSWTYEGKPLQNLPWLSSLVFYGAWRLGGVEGMVLCQGLTGLLCAAQARWLSRARGVSWRWFALVIFVAQFLIIYRLALLRSLSTPFVLLPLAALLWWRGGARPWSAWRWGLVGVMALWANSHGSVSVFALWVGLHLAWDWWQAPSRGRLGANAALLGAVLLASLASPTGWQTWALVLKSLLPHARELNLQLNQEAQPLTWELLLGTRAPALLLGALALPAVAALPWRRYGHEFLFFAAMWALALGSVRFTGLVGLAALLSLPGWLHALQEGAAQGGRARAGWRAALAVLALAGALTPLWSWRLSQSADHTIFPDELGLGMQEHVFAVNGAQFLRDNPVQGRLYNELSQGGWLYWAAPSKQVFLDGRVNVLFDDAFFVQTQGRFYGEDEGLLEELERWGVSVAVVEHGPLSEYLWRDERWAQVVVDDCCATYLRRGAGNDALLARRGYGFFHVAPYLALQRAQWEHMRGDAPEAFARVEEELERALREVAYPAPRMRELAQLYVWMRGRAGEPAR